MPTFIVTETVCYEVEADSAEDAEQIIINADDEQIRTFPQWVEERDASER